MRVYLFKTNWRTRVCSREKQHQSSHLWYLCCRWSSSPDPWSPRTSSCCLDWTDEEFPAAAVAAAAPSGPPFAVEAPAPAQSYVQCDGPEPQQAAGHRPSPWTLWSPSSPPQECRTGVRRPQRGEGVKKISTLFLCVCVCGVYICGVRLHPRQSSLTHTHTHTEVAWNRKSSCHNKTTVFMFHSETNSNSNNVRRRKQSHGTTLPVTNINTLFCQYWSLHSNTSFVGSVAVKSSDSVHDIHDGLNGCVLLQLVSMTLRHRFLPVLTSSEDTLFKVTQASLQQSFTQQW